MSVFVIDYHLGCRLKKLVCRSVVAPAYSKGPHYLDLPIDGGPQLAGRSQAPGFKLHSTRRPDDSSTT